MPKKTSLKLNQNRGSHRRTSLMGVAIAASLSLAACSSNGSTGTDDLGGGGGGGDGGDGDMTLPVTPPPGSHRVTVTLSPATGAGSVTSQSGGISCGIGTGQCAGDFTDGTAAVLTAVGAVGYAFTGWTGACAGQGAVCTLTISADVAITANFRSQSCSTDGVCWEAPLPFGYDLRAVTAISATDAWAVGNAGVAVHYDGTKWTHVPTGTTLDLTDVWARNTNDVWATTGGSGTMYHYTGTTGGWVKVLTGTADLTTHVWGTANKVFVTTEKQFILDFDGTTWTKRDANTGRTDSVWGALTGTSNTDVWAFSGDNYICHFTGAWACTRPDIATAATLNLSSGAYAFSASDIWEVTSAGYAAHNAAPNFGAVGYGFNTPAVNSKFATSATGLWGTSSSSLYTVGPAATMYHYNGTAWSPIATGVTDTTLSNLYGTSNTDVWAVGGRGVIAHYNGTAATTNRSNIFTGTNINAVWASSPTDAWFTTNARTVVHYDGATFTENQPLTTGQAGALLSVWGTSAKDVWAGGFDKDGPIMQHWNGTAWAIVPQPAGFTGAAKEVDAIYAATPTAAWAAGYPATGVEKWNGTAWVIDNSLGATQPITKLWGSSDTNVFAIEDTTTKLWLYNGAVWSVDTRISAVLTAIGGSAATDVWAGGVQGVYHFNGSTWSAKIAIAGASGAINSVSSTSAMDAWAVDSNSAVFHTTDGGTTWKTVDVGVTQSPNTLLKSFSVNANLNWLASTKGILSYRK